MRFIPGIKGWFISNNPTNVIQCREGRPHDHLDRGGESTWQSRPTQPKMKNSGQTGSRKDFLQHDKGHSLKTRRRQTPFILTHEILGTLPLRPKTPPSIVQLVLLAGNQGKETKSMQFGKKETKCYLITYNNFLHTES